MLTTQELPKSAFPDALMKTDKAVGQYATADLYAGDVLTAAKLFDTREATDIMDTASEKGKQVVSMTLPSLAAGVSGPFAARRYRGGHGDAERTPASRWGSTPTTKKRNRLVKP